MSSQQPASQAQVPQSAPLTRGALLEVRDLRVRFPSDVGEVKAVDGITYTIAPSETLAIVGESGSGKSVSALAVMGLLPESARIPSGEVLFKGKNLLQADEEELRKIRGQEIAMIFQDPLTALNPVFTVSHQIAEVIRTHTDASKTEAKNRAVELMRMVGIPNADKRADDYPHQFSGGMRQRIMIAMAIALSPDLLIADEPTTALDVTVQAQILDLLRSLQEEFRMALVLITHDLGMVAEHADRVAVMYAGKIVEYAPIDDVFYQPEHPYAIGLMSSMPRLDQMSDKRLRPIRGQPPSLAFVPPACPFHPRCDYAQPVCSKDFPELMVRTGDPNHLSACHFAGDLPERRRLPDE